MVYARDSKPLVERHESSSLSPGTKIKTRVSAGFDFKEHFEKLSDARRQGAEVRDVLMRYGEDFRDVDNKAGEAFRMFYSFPTKSSPGSSVSSPGSQEAGHTCPLCVSTYCAA